MGELVEVTFVTSSSFKREENKSFVEACMLSAEEAVRDVFRFNLVDNQIQETLHVSLLEIVASEAKAAYAQLKRPCVVEHAGLIFDEFEDDGYPGRLTKPMWNTLGDRFLEETHSAGRGAKAVAVVGYCDGMSVKTFVGETAGALSEEPRGDRAFYWDTIFVPRESNPDALTYAEIVEKHGLDYKMRVFSQSAKAMVRFLSWRRENEPALWGSQA